MRLDNTGVVGPFLLLVLSFAAEHVSSQTVRLLNKEADREDVGEFNVGTWLGFTRVRVRLCSWYLDRNTARSSFATMAKRTIAKRTSSLTACVEAKSSWTNLPAVWSVNWKTVLG